MNEPVQGTAKCEVSFLNKPSIKDKLDAATYTLEAKLSELAER